MKIINLYGGPGTGKSTSAAFLFYTLKQRGVNCELVREYAKDWAWEGRKIGPYDQLYFLGKQIRRESMLYDKVDCIITDSPVMLSVFYATTFGTPLIAGGVRESVRAFYAQAEQDGHQHYHCYLRRSKPYQPAGRYQTEQESRDIDGSLKLMLDTENLRRSRGFETSDAELLRLLRWVDYSELPDLREEIGLNKEIAP